MNADKAAQQVVAYWRGGMPYGYALMQVLDNARIDSASDGSAPSGASWARKAQQQRGQVGRIARPVDDLSGQDLERQHGEMTCGGGSEPAKNWPDTQGIRVARADGIADNAKPGQDRPAPSTMRPSRAKRPTPPTPRRPHQRATAANLSSRGKEPCLSVTHEAGSQQDPTGSGQGQALESGRNPLRPSRVGASMSRRGARSQCNHERGLHPDGLCAAADLEVGSRAPRKGRAEKPTVQNPKRIGGERYPRPVGPFQMTVSMPEPAWDYPEPIYRRPERFGGTNGN